MHHTRIRKARPSRITLLLLLLRGARTPALCGAASASASASAPALQCACDGAAAQMMSDVIRVRCDV
jgi:hypothetical protein